MYKSFIYRLCIKVLFLVMYKSFISRLCTRVYQVYLSKIQPSGASNYLEYGGQHVYRWRGYREGRKGWNMYLDFVIIFSYPPPPPIKKRLRERRVVGVTLTSFILEWYKLLQDPVMYDKLLPVRKSIEELLSPAAKNFYLREFEFFKVN